MKEPELLSLVDLLRRRAGERPNELAYQYLVDGHIEGERFTYKELYDRARAISESLLTSAERGDRALLLYPPGPEFLLAFFGCLHAGIIAIPLPPPDAARMKRTLPRLQTVIRDARASLVLTTDDILNSLQGHFNESAAFRELTWIDTTRITASEGNVAGAHIAWEPSWHDIAFLQYTSGSTSAPKGVTISHGNVLHQCQQLAVAAGYTSHSIAATWMPYHHDYGLIEGLIQPLFVGIPCYFMSPLAFVRRPVRWLEAISRYRVTHSQAPNFAYDLCVQKITPTNRDTLDLSCWIAAANAAETVRSQTLKEFHAAFKDCGLQWRSLAPAYGLAEATLIVTHKPTGKDPVLFNAQLRAYEQGKLVAAEAGDTYQTVVGCGRVLKDTRVEIVDPESCCRCVQGEVGEIWIAGQSVAHGYWNRPDETERIFQAYLMESKEGPFLRTGDLGSLIDGELFVTGRLKDLIIIRGLNHYPQDIELTVEQSHPALRKSFGAAFSIDANGEEVLVVVQEVQGRHSQHLVADEVFSSIRAAIYDNHDLRVYAILLARTGEVFKTTSGKVQRRAIKEAFLKDELVELARWQNTCREGHSSSEPVEVSKASSSNRASIREWLVNWLAAKAGIEPAAVDGSTPFSNFGLDSLRTVELANELESWLQRPVEVTAFWNFPTVNALATHLSENSTPLAEQTRNASHPRALADEEIAVIGMACRFPGGANSPDAFWTLLRDGIDAISDIPSERWDVDRYFDADPKASGKMYTRRGGFVSGIDEFDAAFFGITPREASEMDPQQRVLLEVAWESFEDAGIAPSILRGTETGVFVGLSSDDYASWFSNEHDPAAMSTYRMLGTARSVAAGRIAYVLGLQGPAMQLDTACSSSLMAVQQACQSLQAGESNLALAGGINLILSPAMMVALCKSTALAPDGHCKTFDAAADGYVRGEGCGMIVLKRLSDAIRDRDRVLATIRGAVSNHDGASNGLTAPNGMAQERLHRKALRKARLDGRDVAYVEAHGTGTSLGDPIELEAIHHVYGEGRTISRPLYIGSAKTNIGHLEAAAGIAGLIKVILMLGNDEIVPHLHFHTPTPHVNWAAMPMTVPTQRMPWPTPAQSRLAAVSSFGVSGTNAHVILEGPALRLPCAGIDARSVTSHSGTAFQRLPFHLFVLSARNDTALTALAAKYVAHLDAHPDLSIEDICFTAATGRTHFTRRLAIVAASREELLDKLRRFAFDQDHTEVIVRNIRTTDDECLRTGFLFTGQGTQYVGMGRELYETQPVFRAAIERCSELLREKYDLNLVDCMYGEPSSADWLNQTENTQTTLFALQYALVELWKSWGVRPDAVIGHSSGELAAACVAGVFDLEVGLELIAVRGRLMGALPATGTMAIVMADESRVAAAIKPYGEQVSIASINGPDTIVISGVREAVSQVLTELAADGIDVELLNTSNAGHSSLIEPMLEPFRAVAEKFQYSPPHIAMISNLSGQLAGDEVAGGDYWVRHTRAPVRFADGMESLAALGCRTFIEIGPNPNLLAMGMGCVKSLRPRPRWLPSLIQDRDSCETMLYSLAELYADGAAVDWQGFYKHQPHACSRVSLPTYAFQREAYPLSRVRPRKEFPRPNAVAKKLDPMRVGLEDESQILTPRLDEIAVRYIIDAVQELGFTWSVGAEFTESDLQSRIPAPHQPKVARVFRRLVERGWLSYIDHRYRVTKPAPSESSQSLLAALRRESSYPECDLLGRAGPALAGIWQGDVEPLSILFPDGATDQAADFYSRAKLLAGYNAMAGAAIREACALPQDGERLSVLEVGAGTGGLTMHLLPNLPVDRCDYVFTDVSPLFLNAAHERFRDFAGLQTKLLDISHSPLEQGFTPRSFDVVVAANVLHATPRLRDTLLNVRQLLKPHGWLMLLEGANPPLWGDMVFTLIDGWWSFEDKHLRPDYPLMRRDRWCTVLAEAGFDEVACLSDAQLEDDSSNTLYLASSSSAASTMAFQGRRPVTMAAVEDPPVSSTALEGHRTNESELSQLVLSHAARVMRLRPEQIDPTQPLSELGLDSLMASELRAQLAETLRRELTLNSLQMRRSIIEITKYLHEDQVRHATVHEASDAHPLDLDVTTARAHLVPLRPEGGKTPLFFVPAGYGDLFAFQEIADALGMEQPVYGLQPASAKQVKTFRQMSVYRLVTAYIDEIKQVQPTGPYFLSGYSAGGIIVVELARELLRQGNEVGLLVIFDPPSHVPFWLDWFYAAIYRSFAATRLIQLVRRSHSKWARRLFHTVLDEGLRTHSTVIREHHVDPLPGRITHFRSRLSQSSLVSMKPMGRFWRRVAAEGTEVHWIPGTHYGMLRGKGASVVVDELRDCLHRAEASESKRQSP